MDTAEPRLGETEEAPVRRSPGRPPRSARVASDERVADERGQDDRESDEDRDLTEDERFEQFLASNEQSVLPDLPELPGYHTCWLTTTNARDSIPNRLRMGYELIRLEDCRGWEGVSLTAGDYAGVIGVNEMVAARIPYGLYQRMMSHNHHNLPLAEEEKLRRQVDAMKREAEERGSRVLEGDGTASLARRARPPVFA